MTIESIGRGMQWPVKKLREELTWTEIAAAILLINAASFLMLPQKGWWVLNGAIGLTAASYGLGGKLVEQQRDANESEKPKGEPDHPTTTDDSRPVVGDSEDSSEGEETPLIDRRKGTDE